MKKQNILISSSALFSCAAAFIRSGMAALPSRLAGGTAWLVMAFLALSAGPASAQTLMDRYSFTTDASDSVGANNGTLQGDASIASGGGLSLDGGAG
jgi:hypothetical protein